LSLAACFLHEPCAFVAQSYKTSKFHRLSLAACFLHEPCAFVAVWFVTSCRYRLPVASHIPHCAFGCFGLGSLPCLFPPWFYIFACNELGAGKTVILELALVKMLETSPDSKGVYMAPTKALCNERHADWKKKFGRSPLNYKVCLITGDSDSDDIHTIADASIIVTTPEKWRVAAFAPDFSLRDEWFHSSLKCVSVLAINGG
jgi:hypothetical protein